MPPLVGVDWSVRLVDGSGNPITFGGSGASAQQVQGTAAAGAAPVGNPLQVGLFDGALMRTVLGDTAGRVMVVGAAADGAALVGNPIPMAGTSSGTARIISVFNPSTNLTGVGFNLVGVVATGSVPYSFNGASWDVLRSHQDAILQASTATAVGTINYDITTYNARFLIIHYNVTNYNAGNVTIKVQMKDANGLFADLANATTGAVSTGADIFLVVGANSWPANASPVFYANNLIPRTIRIVQTIGAATVTLSGAYSLTV